MAITQLTGDVNIHQSLPDLPNTTDGLSAAQLKAKYDEAAALIKTYLNSTLVAELESVVDGSSGADNIGATAIATSPSTIQGILEWLKTRIDDTVLGQIPDGSLTEVKLSFDPATQAELDTNKASNTQSFNDQEILLWMGV